MSSLPHHNSKWPVDLLGPAIRLNQWEEDHLYDHDEEAQSYLATMDAVDGYQYVAIFMGANYCPDCKTFVKTLLQSIHAFEQRKCKVIMASNDRNKADFEETCAKVRGIDVMPYDIVLSRRMRVLFDVQTIPALLIFRIDEPKLIFNARHALEADRSLRNFPWAKGGGHRSHTTKNHVSKPTTKYLDDSNQLTERDDSGCMTTNDSKHTVMTPSERFLIQGAYGKWYHRGHRNVTGSTNNATIMYMDEHAVRVRAGILSSISWIALMNIFFFQDHTLVKVLFPLVAFEFLTSILFGLTPIAPIGTVATGVAMTLQPQPHWKPADPKRFAWFIGLILSCSWYVSFSFRDELGGPYRYIIAGIALTCNLATWLESSAGFCVGCFVYNMYVVPLFFDDLEECDECYR